MNIRKFTKEEAVNKVISNSKEYQKILADKDFIVLYKDKDTNRIESLELIFRPSNYQHLTGLLLLDLDGNIKKYCSMEFYHKCISGLLTKDEIQFKNNITTNMKLDCLDILMSFTKISKISGEYDKSRGILLEGDYLIGGIHGFYTISKNGEEETYYPRSVIKGDIRKYSVTNNQVLAILSSHYKNKDNYEVEYIAKGVKLENLTIPKEIKGKINSITNIGIENDYEEEIER